MRIPEIQNRLLRLAAAHSLPELAELADALYRRKPPQRAAAVSARMTPETRGKIKALHAADPDLPLARIAAALNVNPGRVSEVLRGFRK
jgi:hypothetical protein